MTVVARNWDAAALALDTIGHAVVPDLLTRDECAHLIDAYPASDGFRKRVVMASHGFGRGEYKYFAEPLPAAVARLRAALYPPLAAVANRWNEALHEEARFPSELPAFLDRCHAAGQTKPTPLLLAYGEGDYNCLHQDVYGEHLFPLQVTVLLSSPDDDFSGGEFVLAEQRPRAQSRAEVVPLERGAGVIFPVRYRPARTARGAHRVTVRHGVSRIRAGLRFTLGIIFHDAL